MPPSNTVRHWFQAALDAFQVGQHQLGVDRRRVRCRIDGAFDMGDVLVLEATQDMNNGVDLADVGQEAIAQAFAGGRAADQTGDVDEGHEGRHGFCRAGDPCQLVHPWLGHRHLADVWLDGAERIILRRRLRRAGHGVEKRRLADVRQSDDAALEAHVLEILVLKSCLRPAS